MLFKQQVSLQEICATLVIIRDLWKKYLKNKQKKMTDMTYKCRQYSIGFSFITYYFF